MEKKKLLLVAISVGVFLALTIGAAIMVFTPKNTDLPFETVASNSNPEAISLIPPSPFQSYITATEPQPSSIDAVDLVRNPGGVPGLVTPPEGANYYASDTGRGTGSVISVTQPTTAAVPSTAPTGRAANQSTPTATARPAQTTTTPAQTASTTAKTTTTPAQTASTTAKTTTTPAQTASTTAKTTTTPAQTASTTAKTTTTPAQAAPAASTGNQSSPAAQTRIYDDYWVQTGAFSTVARAEGVKETLASKGITSIIENGNVNGRTLFRVRVGPYTTRNEANYWLALIKSMDGFEDSQVRQTENLR